MKCLDPAHRQILDVLAVSVNPGEISVFEELIFFFLQLEKKGSVEETACREGELDFVIIDEQKEGEWRVLATGMDKTLQVRHMVAYCDNQW